MNRLTQKAPDYVRIDDVEYKINTDFRDCLNIILAYEDDELTSQEKVGVLLSNLYDEEDLLKIKDLKKAAEMGVFFLDCGEDFTIKIKKEKRVYSFEQDSKYIHSALLNKPNGVNLDEIGYMHWWTFISHYMDMGESMFSRIIYLRRQNQKGKLTKEERQECDHIGWDVINLKSNINSDDKAMYENLLMD